MKLIISQISFRHEKKIRDYFSANYKTKHNPSGSGYLFNRAAEDAAKEAKPIFISAIKQMTIQDAWSILLKKVFGAQ